MNVMGLVFSILLVLSFGFYAGLEKEAILRRLDKTFIGSANVSRKIMNAYESESYKEIRSTKKPKKKSAPPKETAVKTIPLPPKINPPCARLNLWPLLTTGREENQLLYEELAELLRVFYKKHLFHFFSDPSHLEYRLLDLWIAGLKHSLTEKPDTPIVLEKTDLNDPSLQILYYNMLRGAEWQYPSLLDFVKVIQVKDKEEKLCLFHATPELLSVFFGNAAKAIYEEMHSDKIIVTEEMIEEICRTHQYTLFNKELFDLLSLTRVKHEKSSEITLIEEDPVSHISLRKKIYLQKS